MVILWESVCVCVMGGGTSCPSGNNLFLFLCETTTKSTFGAEELTASLIQTCEHVPINSDFFDGLKQWTVDELSLEIYIWKNLGLPYWSHLCSCSFWCTVWRNRILLLYSVESRTVWAKSPQGFGYGWGKVCMGMGLITKGRGSPIPQHSRVVKFFKLKFQS